MKSSTNEVVQDDVMETFEGPGTGPRAQEPPDNGDIRICYSVMPSIQSKGTDVDFAEGTWSSLMELYRDSALDGIDPDEVAVHNLIEYEPGKRTATAAIYAYGVIIETDDAAWNIDDIARTLRQHGLMGAIYETKSHTPEEPRYRVVIPLAEPISADRYGRAVRYVEALLGGQFDPDARRVFQFQRLPTVHARVEAVDGSPLDPSCIPGATDHGEPLIPVGLRLFPKPKGPDVLGPVTACNLTGAVGKLLDPMAAQAMTESERIAGLLGQICVSHRDEYRVRQPNGLWVPATRNNALSLLKEHWTHIRQSGVEIEPEKIDAALRRNEIPTVFGVLASTVAADFVEFQGRRYLNVGFAPRFAPTTFGEDGKLLLEFIVRNICADERDIGHVMAEATADAAEPTPTRWFLHWIAHQYQQPGIALLTAVWLISVEQGVGKTLFAELFRDLLGRPSTTAANAAELKGDWSDWQAEKTLVIADEINVIERHSFYATIKRWVANPTISIRQRNVGQFEIPATANWLFLTNELRPIALDAANRRHMMIECINDRKAAAAMIERIRPIVFDNHRRKAALAELGAWLAQVPVDVRLIQRALPTALKDDIIDTTKTPMERWLADAVESGVWKLGQFIPFDELCAHYQTWAASTGTFKGSAEGRVFQSGLQTAKRRGLVQDGRGRVPVANDDRTFHTVQKRGWTLVKIPPGVVSPEPGADSKLAEMRAKRAKEVRDRLLAATTGKAAS